MELSLPALWVATGCGSQEENPARPLTYGPSGNHEQGCLSAGHVGSEGLVHGPHSIAVQLGGIHNHNGERPAGIILNIGTGLCEHLQVGKASEAQAPVISPAGFRTQRSDLSARAATDIAVAPT